MAKDFKSKNPLDHFSAPKEAPIKQAEIDVPVKKRVGRPKTKDVKGTCKNINIAVPITLLDKWEEIKIIHGSNLTEYITKLIEKDMDSNYDKYKTILNSLNDFK